MAYNFNEIKLEKGMYSERGRSFEQTLEALDPNENYKGTPYEGLDAFQRQLKRFDIKVRGAGSDVVEKFFSTSESAVLFPEYVSRSVKAGMEEGNILPSITATVTRFDGMDYRSIYSAASEDDKSLRYVGEGAAIPQTEVRASDHLVSLKKRGRMLVASYEAIRFQRLDLFSVMLAAPDVMIKILKCSEFQNPLAGLNFQGTGEPGNPLGAKLIRCSAMPAGTAIGLDKGYALEMVTAGDVNVEYDRLIDRQLERAAITSISGFAKLYTEASKVLTV